MKNRTVVHVDASNIRVGGGITHLRSLLAAAAPGDQGIERVVVWGRRKLLERLPAAPWLDLRTDPALEKSLAARLLWQATTLERWLKSDCDVLFVPGGTYVGRFHPYVTMSRNLLPFMPAERRRYGISVMRAKMILLEAAQTRSFRRADGVIFLTEAARNIVIARSGPLPGITTVIPHGVGDEFRRPPHTDVERRPLRLLYVSVVYPYKHQAEVVQAVVSIRASGRDLLLDLVGPGEAKFVNPLLTLITAVDPESQFIRYLGPVAAAQLPDVYAGADAFVFASSCENMPNILVEAMAAALPIACSDHAPMPEVLGDGGVYFNPLSAESIASAIVQLYDDPSLRSRLSSRAAHRSMQFNWSETAQATFGFLRTVADAHC